MVAENYKLLYENMKMMVKMYQDGLVPQLKETIANQKSEIQRLQKIVNIYDAQEGDAE